MLTPKTTAMNAAKAPHCTRYRRTANRRNHPRTTPMSRSPSWLMSVSFPPGRGTPSRPTQIKEPRRFSRDITRGRLEAAKRLNYFMPRCPRGGGRPVRAKRLSRMRVRERAVEQLLPQLRNAVVFDDHRAASALVSDLPAGVSVDSLPDARPAGVPGRLSAVRMGPSDARQPRGRHPLGHLRGLVEGPRLVLR